ncbi:MAG: prepilin-type N-terminal cleavage/methylation domain-containing protein [Acidobacteriia bacterium]|nr:prepilin-type N-terminal cleavage/methylation domain-containing protein [Terriglobia bacterium]
MLIQGFPRRRNGAEGFSLAEMLVSIAIITVLMAIVFQFLQANQNRYRSNQLLGEINQGGRSAFEVLSQELNQAGYNPPLLLNKTIGGSSGTTYSPATTGRVIGFPIAGATGDPFATKRLFYGTRLVIGNNCTSVGTTCNQEELLINADPTYNSTVTTNNSISTTNVPVVITNQHAAGEAVFTRNYPYPQGIIYADRTATSTTPNSIADNKLLFFGDIMNTGDLYYGEYRLQCPGSTAGTWVDACTTGCMTAPFTLTRFVTKLANATTGVFTIPASKAAALDGATVSPLVDNILGTCPTVSGSPGTAPSWTQHQVATVPDETVGGNTNVYAAINYNNTAGTGTYVEPVLNPDGTPVIWFKVNTYGGYDSSTSPPTAYFQSFMIDVRIVLTVQEAQKDPETNTYRTQRLQSHIVPKNINDALTVALNGGASFLPPIPIDPTTNNTLPLP